MKLLALLLVATASGVAVTGGAIALGGGTSAKGATGVQHLTMHVMPGDHILGKNLVLAKGRVELTIVNSARHAHTFTVPALGIDQVVLPGSPSAPSTTRLSFRVMQDGAYTWFCMLPCKHAMRGNIFVLDQPPALHGPFWAVA